MAIMWCNDIVTSGDVEVMKTLAWDDGGLWGVTFLW